MVPWVLTSPPVSDSPSWPWHWSGLVRYSVDCPRFRFVWCLLTFRLRLCILGKDAIAGAPSERLRLFTARHINLDRLVRWYLASSYTGKLLFFFENDFGEIFYDHENIPFLKTLILALISDSCLCQLLLRWCNGDFIPLISPTLLIATPL